MGAIFTWVFILGLLSLRVFAAEPSKKGMLPGYWSSAVKTAVGTSYESYDGENTYSHLSTTAPLSKVWFTAAQGVLTEVFWPTSDAAQVRDSQILVTDGNSFFFEERKDAISHTEWLESGVPAFRILNRDPKGRFTIEKLIFADPDRDVVLQRVRIQAHVEGLQFYLLHNPAVGNTPLGDNASTETPNALVSGLFAWQENHAQAVVATLPFKQTSAGFEGTASDGFHDLKTNFRLDSTFPIARNGNVVLTAQLDIPAAVGNYEFELALAFSPSVDQAYKLARASLDAGLWNQLEKYKTDWRNYQASVRDLSGGALDSGSLFKASVAVMKIMEDKTYAGAFVASPSVPWGLHQEDWNGSSFNERPRKRMVSGYHIVWPRDLFQMATAMMAIEDYKSAIASLNYLRRIQYGPADGDWTFGKHVRRRDGSFPQNCWMDGENHWGGLQLDEVGMPVVLAYRLWKAEKISLDAYWDMVHRAADFIADFGPWSPQERWEEVFGVTPSTTAAQIAALRSAAEMAEAKGDSERASRYRALSREWAAKIASWTFTTSGAHGNGRYFTRIEGAAWLDQPWDPNDETRFTLANGAGHPREKDVVDGGFLELVRFGVMPALSSEIQETLEEYDSTIGVDLGEIGFSFRRYLGDRYNYDDDTYAQTPGMPWPLLSGERGHYELQRAIERGLSEADLDRAIRPAIQTLEGVATQSLMIPEQVWDAGDRVGKPTGAATPLGWAHGEYVKLLRSRIDRKVFDLRATARR